MDWNRRGNKAHNQISFKKIEENRKKEFEKIRKTTLKEGAGFPRGSIGAERPRSWEQWLSQRDSSDAETLSFLLTQDTATVSLASNLDIIALIAKSPKSSNLISMALSISSFSLYFLALVCLVRKLVVCNILQPKDERDQSKGVFGKTSLLWF